MYYNVYVLVLLEVNVLFLAGSILIGGAMYYLSKYANVQLLKDTKTSTAAVKFVLISGLIISFFLHCFCFLTFLQARKHGLSLALTTWETFGFGTQYALGAVVPGFSGLKLSIEFFGFIFIFIAYAVGIISFLALDTRLYWKNIRFVFTCNFLVLVIYLFCTVNDFLIFFLLYESMLIPSFLFVYFVSPYRRGIQASLYFLIWTQIGSFLVLCSVGYIIYMVGGTGFIRARDFTFTSEEIFFIYLLLFLGFGFKVPIWPFHYWLTKTHVEAPAGFSIFLSGFLVKSAVYGFYKLSNTLGGEVDTTIFSVFCLMGVVDASLKMWGQTDLKKLVAYGTIQEMNLIYLAFLLGDTNAFIGGVSFCVMHAFLSSLMFFLVDCIQRRYKSRSITEVTGILHRTPNLGISILGMHVFFSALPGTLKFVSEIYIFGGLFETMPGSVILLIFAANYLGLLGFSKCWFNAVFGLTMTNQDDSAVDLTAKELNIILTCFLFMFSLGFVLNVVI